MPYKNAAFSQKFPNRIAVTKMTSNAFFKLGIFLSLAALTQISGWNKPIHALDFSNSFVRQTSNLQRGLDSLKSEENSAFLPQIFNLLAFSAKPQAVNASEAIPPQIKPQIDRPDTRAKLKRLAPVTESPAQIYQVKQGDTIYKIARQYHVSTTELVELNQIQNATSILVGRELKIPNSQRSAIANLTSAKSQVSSSKTSQPLTPKAKPNNLSESQTKPTISDTSLEEDPYISRLRAEIDELRAQYQQEQKLKNSPSRLISAVEPKTQLETNQPTSAANRLNSLSESNLESNSPEVDTIALTLPPLADDEYLPNAFDGYTWPAQGVLTSGYGRRWGRLHKGIDIAAPIGTPIVAAAAGKVVGAGWHGGYGNLIKLEHLDGSLTLYAHANRILVTHGQQVKQGELIAEMGSTGHSTGSHLHFEIHLRDRTIANPLALLTRK